LDSAKKPETFLDLYLQYATEQTDAPRIFHEYLAYFILSSVIGKSIHTKFGYKDLYPNLYLLLIAPSSIHRKSWSQNMAIHIIREIHRDILIPDCSSRESFIAEFADKERTPHETGVFKIDEFKGFMDRMKNNNYFSGFIQDLSSMYDGDPVRRRKGVDNVETYTIEKPFLNITAACSTDWLNQAIQSADISGGFLARFIWVISNDLIVNPSPWPKMADGKKRSSLIGKLENIRRILDVKLGSHVDFLNAEYRWNEWYQGFYSNHQGGMWDANYHRMSITVRKLAILNCIMRYEAKGIEANQPGVFLANDEDVTRATELGEKSIRCLDMIQIGNGKFDLYMKKALRVIMKADGMRLEGCEHRVVQQNVKVSSFIMKQVIESLKDMDLIEINRGPKGGLVYKAKEGADGWLAS